MTRLSLYFAVLLVLCGVGIADAQWRCLYATYDDNADGNAIGAQAASVGVIKDNTFIALVSAWSGTTSTNCYMLPYVNADSAKGRKYGYGYDPGNVFQVWTDGGFDQVIMAGAWKIKAMPDSLIYVADNGADHNILVFKFTGDTITTVPVKSTGVYPREQTGTASIHGIDVDANGYVYVCVDSTTGATKDIMVYKPIAQWTAGHTDAPACTVDLPDGKYQGIAVSPDGKMIFVTDYTHRKVLKYKGTPATGYTADTGFNFALSAGDTTSAGARGGPLGAAYLAPNNILAVACGQLLTLGAGYSYGRIYMVNPNNGTLISPDTSVNYINTALWNLTQTGGYNKRTGGTTPGNASGYTSTYDVKWDGAKNLYTQSYYGWTVDKWQYQGTLPTITVTGVEEIGGTTPSGYVLAQNYPNPFNPTTTIDFTIPVSGHATLAVYDLLGREVASLVNEIKSAGTYRATFDASHLTTGTYFYSLRVGSFSEMKKMLLLK
jgi:hypothetical protein